jgi:hypothetical protein
MFTILVSNTRFEDRQVGQYADADQADAAARAFTQRRVGVEWPSFDASWRFVRVETPDGCTVRR